MSIKMYTYAYRIGNMMFRGRILVYGIVIGRVYRFE